MLKVQSFMGKVTHDGLHHMDDHINTWLKSHKVKPLEIKQSFGVERLRGDVEEPVVIITLWFEAEEEEEF